MSSSARTSVIAFFSLFACLAACAAPTEEEDADSDGSALSDATCKPRAEKAEKEALAKCKSENPLLDWTKCMAPADKAWNDYVALVAEARRPVEAQVQAVTGACKADVDQLSVDELIKQALPKATDYDRAAAKKDAKRVAMLREQRKLQCESDAKDDLEEKLDANSVYMTLLDMETDKQLSWAGSYIACGIQGAYASFKNSMCSGKSAYDNVYATCRKECSKLSDDACTPKDYGSEDVACGKLVNEKGWSWKAGMTCEETSKCVRTDVCNQYDAAKESAAELNAKAPCTVGGAKGILVPTIKKDSKGRAVGVETTCTDPTAAATASE